MRTWHQSLQKVLIFPQKFFGEKILALFVHFDCKAQETAQKNGTSFFMNVSWFYQVVKIVVP
jgi:hypothetical protein